MTEIKDSPPRRSRRQLEAWVKEFEDGGHCIPGRISVAPQEDADREDTGLVIVHLRNAPSSIHIKPRGYDDPVWEATLSAQTDDHVMSVNDIANLAAEVVIAGNLCAFLQWKSLDWDRNTGRRAD